MKGSLSTLKLSFIFFSKELSKERRTEEKVQWELYLHLRNDFFCSLEDLYRKRQSNE